MNFKHGILFLVFGAMLSSCSSSSYFKKSELKELDNMLTSAPMNHHMGFLFKDLGTNQILRDYNSSKYFTPASNTKIVSLATGFHVLNDSIPFVDYYQKGDSLFIRGLGDPTFLHPDFNSDGTLAFLRNANVLVLDQTNFKENRFGSGWSWDDYNGAYQVERSALPMYGNIVVFNEEKPTISYFDPVVDYISGPSSIRIQRDRRANKFTVVGKAIPGQTMQMPLVVSDSLTRALLHDTLGIKVIAGSFDTTLLFQTKYSHPVIELYTPMMQRSDNFFADQILLMSSQQALKKMKEEDIIQWAKENIFDTPDELLWVDGSGLSRYNQFSPRSIVRILQRLHTKVGHEKLLPIFASGGESGTISNWYNGDDGKPYVFAKTGTLRNVHCLSGFLRADSGRWFVFSFMHNNFPGGSSTVKRPMEKILKYLKATL